MKFPKRKPTRLKRYDYSQNGAYFITICTDNRKSILGNIVGQGLAPAEKNGTSKPVPYKINAMYLNKIVGEGLCALLNKRAKIENFPYRMRINCLLTGLF